ncbi:DUF4190 domain-containing protein [Bifidobacterium sp. ESL0800]|uniref:DUF4190 domain-containing protein n=1 Tax=Bifidobacterium sp. ESL0800 TaxID=2983236 RepID=UPI0023F84415|nr:DUF4190 domain-containing protein [Bifidobacterium sp. ESL0800]WEV75811.1 DUF4190 domain-containing protein [Bifidobacterium sp. ESL0800]
MNDNDFNASPNQAPYQYSGANPQTPNYQPYGFAGPGSVPPSGPGPMPPSGPGPMPPMGPQGYYAPAPNQKWNTLCIVGFALSFFMPFIGLILSVIALVQINRSGEKSKGMSIAGIAIGAVLTVLDIIVAVAIVSAFGYAFNHMDSDYPECHGSDCYSDPFDNDGDDPDDPDDEDNPEGEYGNPFDDDNDNASYQNKDHNDTYYRCDDFGSEGHDHSRQGWRMMDHYHGPQHRPSADHMCE